MFKKTLVALPTWDPGFVHHCSTISLRGDVQCIPSRNGGVWNTVVRRGTYIQLWQCSLNRHGMTAICLVKYTSLCWQKYC